MADEPARLQIRPLGPAAAREIFIREALVNGVEIEKLKGTGPFDRLLHAPDRGRFEHFVRGAREGEGTGIDIIRPIENQFLLQQRQRLYRHMTFGQLRRCQCDIEVASPDGGSPDATRAEDRVLAIGLRTGGKNKLLLLEEASAAAEKKLLEDFNAALAEIDPDTIEGHNLFTDTRAAAPSSSSKRSSPGPPWPLKWTPRGRTCFTVATRSSSVPSSVGVAGQCSVSAIVRR